ncbi:hypothetical protein IWQ61_010078 [Dispira simplex]|nr:hypothetical protein IWQ61_010078 [Dispira simplex]
MEKATAGHMDPQGLASGLKVKDPPNIVDLSNWLLWSLEDMKKDNTTESTLEMHDPLLECNKHEKEVTENFSAVMMPKKNV